MNYFTLILNSINMSSVTDYTNILKDLVWSMFKSCLVRFFYFRI